jgi:hypothetical protein
MVTAEVITGVAPTNGVAHRRSVSMSLPLPHRRTVGSSVIDSHFRGKRQTLVDNDVAGGIWMKPQFAY